MNKLSIEKRTQIVGMLVEGNSLRAISRLADVSINTVTKLLVDIGAACQKYHDENVRNLKSKKIQCDEIWSFIYAKDKNLPEDLRGQFGLGSVWTWVAMDSDSKLVVSWLVGNRDSEYAKIFMEDVAGRLSNRVQLTTDGLKAYLEAVEEQFGNDIDFAQLVKLYGESLDKEHKYSPAECTGTKKEIISGYPDRKSISTSHIERQNLTMRMSMRRFTRLTNAFSKKLENHEYALALYFMHYNFVRTHKTLANPYPRTPAMASGLTNHIWTVEEVITMVN